MIATALTAVRNHIRAHVGPPNFSDRDRRPLPDGIRHRSKQLTTSISRALGLAVGAILFLSLTGPISAAPIDELLMYPGSNCRVVSGGPATITTSGRLWNNTAANMTVQCPMYDNGFDFTGAIWVIDNNASANILCNSHIKNPLGNPSLFETKSTTGNASAAMVLTYTGPDASGTFSYRFYTCVLPPTTQIINYRGRAL